MPPYCYSASERGENFESDQTESPYLYLSAEERKIIEMAGVAKFW